MEAQYADVRGVVIDSVKREVLPFSNIRIKGSQRGVSANAHGFFLIPRVPEGNHEIIASHVGYTSKSLLVSIKRNEEVGVRIELSPVSIETDEVVVLGKSKSQLSEITTSLHVLDQADLKLIPVTLQPDVFRSLQILPGIVTTNDLSSKLYVRGGAADQNLVLLDGVRIYHPYHANSAFGSFDPEVVKTVEAFTGGFPAGYGGRLSSVINITTREGRKDRFHGRASVNFLSAGALIEGELDVIDGLNVLAGGRKSISNSPLKRMFGDNTPITYYDSFVKLSKYTAEGGRMSMQMFLTEDRLTESNVTNPDYIWKNSAFSFNAAALLGKRVYVDVVAYLSTYRSERDPKLSRTVTPASTSVFDGGVRGNATFYGENDELYNFGFEFTFPKLEYQLINRLNQPLHLNTLLVESQLWLRLLSDAGSLKYDAGFNFDVGSAFQREFSMYLFQPRVSLSYAAFDDVSLKLSYGRFTQNMLTVSNEDEIFSIFEAWIAIPKELRQSVADHFIGGIDFRPARWMSLNLTGYYKNYLSLVSYNSEKIDQDDPDYINGMGNAHGLEVSAQGRFSGLDLFLSYTLGRTTVKTDFLEYPPRHDRRHSVKLLAVYQLAEGISAHARWDFGSGLPFSESIGFYDRIKLTDIFRENDPGETGVPYTRLGGKNAARLPIYNRVDVGLNYDFSLWGLKGSMGVSITNLFNNKNLLYFDRKTGHSVHMIPFMPTALLSLEY